MEVEVCTVPTLWLFSIVAAGPEDGAGNARYQARQAADLLTGLMRSEAAADLSAKGMMALRPKPGRVIPGVGYALVNVLCRVRMVFSNQ